MSDDLDFGVTIRGYAPGQKVFRRYTLTRILGRGGMGVVWLARDDELERDVALKFLPETIAADRAAIDDLKREVRRAIGLAHPHIVKIHDFVTDGQTAAVAMEYVEGDTLASRRLDQPGKVFTPAQLAPWVAQAAAALTYAHEKARVVHRDLKPANLMIDGAGDLKILDFGIAASLSESATRVSKAVGTSGTPLYMGPQQMMGEQPAVTDDIYAFGATLFELLTGKAPFYTGRIEMQVMQKVAPSLAERRAELGVTGEPVPEAWERLVAACLAKDAAARPQGMTAVAAMLAQPSAPVAANVGVAKAVVEQVVAAKAAIPAAAPKPPGKAAPPERHASLTRVLDVRRWLGAPLAAAVVPAIACAAFLVGWQALSYFYTPQAIQQAVVGLTVSLPVIAVAALLMSELARKGGESVRRGLWAGGALLGAVAAAGVIWYIAQERAGRFEVNPGWQLFAKEILLAAGLGAMVGAVAAYVLRRVAFGVPARKPAVAVLGALGGALVAAFGFGVILPQSFDRTYIDEGDRQYQAWLATERATRATEAVGMIREAYRMVFDRMPTEETVARYTEMLVQHRDWSAARLRQELRSSDEGRQGGRLLVPEEFSTIRAAIEAAVPGNVVHVAPGTYNETVVLTKAVNLIGAGRERVTVQRDAEGAVLIVEVTAPVLVRGFTFRQTTTNDSDRRSAVVVLDSGPVVFEENAVADANGNGLILRAGTEAEVRRNLIRGSRWGGVVLYADAAVTLAENTVEGSEQSGILVNEVLKRALIGSNIVRGNRHNGIWVAHGDNVTLVENQVTGNSEDPAGRTFGGIGIAVGSPALQGNVARDNRGTGIWWNAEAKPVIGPGNVSDGAVLPESP